MNAVSYLDDHRELGSHLPGHGVDWLTARRQAARERFAAEGFPSPREEDWRYTNVAPIEKKRFRPTPTPASLAEVREQIGALLIPGAIPLVLIDGRAQVWNPAPPALPKGVRIGSLADEITRDDRSVESMFGSVCADAAHGFIAFNTAFFTDGVWIDIPAGVRLETPIQILHFSTQADGLATTRSLIRLGANAAATVIEQFAGHAERSYLSAAVTEVQLGDGAQLDFTKLQSESNLAYHFGGLYVQQAPNARFTQHNLAFGGLLVRNDVHTALRKGAEAELNGLFLGQGRRHVDNHTRIDHAEPHGTSRETYRGVLSERSRGVFQGRIIVQPQAQKTSAEMNNRNLLLSDDAEIDTKPQLEILADDVKCAHGVTVGRLDPASVFYLISRGLDTASARSMLTFAFANEIVERIQSPLLRLHCQAELLRRFPESGVRGDWL